ncbi:MAG: hypothetical protein LLF78_05515 [Synergistaceae bacterium]|nr:hypothetical protein [Synergistaceae bacterium]
MKYHETSVSGKRPLVFLGISVIVLLLLSAWSLSGGLFGVSFRIERAVICQELDDDRQPLNIGNSIPYGSRQICLWFRYSSASEGSHIAVSWYYGKELVLSESIKLMAKDGERAFYLLREEGTPLPVGSYRVMVSTPTKVWSEINFNVVRRK